jgi:hypothetical protein
MLPASFVPDVTASERMAHRIWSMSGGESPSVIISLQCSFPV